MPRERSQQSLVTQTGITRQRLSLSLRNPSLQSWPVQQRLQSEPAGQLNCKSTGTPVSSAVSTAHVVESTASCQAAFTAALHSVADELRSSRRRVCNSTKSQNSWPATVLSPYASGRTTSRSPVHTGGFHWFRSPVAELRSSTGRAEPRAL